MEVLKKSKKKNKTLKKKFYKNKKTGHPSLIIAQKHKYVSSLGFTHNKYDFADKIELKHNIDPKGLGKSYVLLDIQKQNSKDYKEKKEFNFFRIHEEDKETINKIIKKRK